MHYSCTNSSTLVIKTVLYLLSHLIKLITCNLYNNILVKSTNQFYSLVLYVQDTHGVYNLHGTPSVLSAITSAVAAGIA